MFKKGDTLIEVLMAVGIFSMIAISVVAVMSGGTSSAQTALETTLAREEIDAQAEALRYIHDSYISNKESNNKNLPATVLWEQIVSNAIELSGKDTEDDAAVLQYAPSSCPANTSENKTVQDHAFILDTRNLDAEPIDGKSQAYILAKDDIGKSEESKVFRQTQTFPRLVFGNDDGSLVENNTNASLKYAEGIYVIAVADKDTTTLVGEAASKEIPFYDFYIRTCWYGTDAETPSTISTVIRLYNPEAGVVDAKPETVNFNYNGNGGIFENIYKMVYKKGSTFNLPTAEQNPFKWPDNNYNGDIWLAGWSTNPNSTPDDIKNKAPGTYEPGQTVYVDDFIGNENVAFYPIWDSNKSRQYWLDVNVFLNNRETDPNGTSGHGSEGFKVKVYINGQIKASTNNDDGDWYAEVPIGSRIQVVLTAPNGYYIPNKSSICGKTQGCSYSYSASNNSYTVNFYIIPESVSTILDSSGHNAIQIEPVWVKK